MKKLLMMIGAAAKPRRGSLKGIGFLVMLCTVCAAAFADTLYPVYTVTTEGGGIVTNYLEECTVQIVDSEGATPREVAYADIDKSAGNFHGTFVIEAASYLMGSVTMTNFTGEIRIRSGALIVDAVGWLGVAAKSKAPKLYVEDGASLVPTCPVTRGGKIYNELHLAGNGYNGIGAFCNRYRASHSDYCFYNYIYIDADTKIGMDSYSRVDMNGGEGRLVLNNHTLTIEDIHAVRTDSRPTFCTYGARVDPGSGHIILDHVSLLVQGYAPNGWLGGPTNTITLTNQSYINYYNTYVPVNWTVIIGENGGYGFIDSGDSDHPAAFPNHYWNSYAGPIHVDGLLYLSHNGQSYSGVSLLGDIYGNGSVDSPGGGWLQLAGTNTYLGTTTVRSGNYTGLALWREEAASTHSAGYFVTNAPIRLVADGRRNGGETIYDLPPLNYHISAGKSYELGATHSESNKVYDSDLDVRGGMDARIASLKKTGDGELTLLANFDITGRTEIVSGTVRLAPASRYSALPGLWEGIFETNETATAELADKGVANIPIYADYNSSMAALSNRVTSSAYLFARKGAPYWHYVMAPTYTGYIWNRETTNVTVTFAVAIVDAWKLYVRDMRQGYPLANMYDGSNMGVVTKTLVPGANAIMLRGWNRKQAGGWFKPSNHTTWNLPFMGFAMAYGNLQGDYDPSHYFVPTNGMAACAGGDGFLFTRDPRAPEDFTAEELASTRTKIADLAMSRAAVLDLAGSPLFIKSLEGVGSITNGDLTVKERWTVGYSAIAAGGLYLDGALTFAEGATVSFDGEGARLSHDRPVERTLVTAGGGITGSPTFTSAGGIWKMSRSANGKSLLATYYPAGTKFIFR